MKRLLIVFCLIIAVSACHPRHRRNVNRNVDHNSEHTEKKHTEKKAVRGLINKAQKQSASGKHQAACVTLERAIRVDSSNPLVWRNMAIVKYRMRDYAAAESMSLRSLSFVHNRGSLYRNNWKLIADARRAMGDKAGAKKAIEKAGN